MKQQTAVDWLDEQLQDKKFIQYGYTDGRMKIIISVYDYIKLKEQAKEMEKEQIIKAYANGANDRLNNMINEYYNETYNI